MAPDRTLRRPRGVEILLNFPMGMAINRMLPRNPERMPPAWRARLDLYFGDPAWYGRMGIEFLFDHFH